MTTVINATQITRHYGKHAALNKVDIRIKSGAIYGLIGPNGAGKTTLLQCIAGMQRFGGSLDVMGHCPWKQRMQVLNNICFIPDTCCLPRWMNIKQLFEIFKQTYTSFDQNKAENYLNQIQLNPKSKIRSLSKGMQAQLHLALIMSINHPIMVLDEPTLGLDPCARDRFFEILIEDYFDDDRTIIISTHHIEEISNLVTDILYLNQGKMVLNKPMQAIHEDYFMLEAINKTATLNQIRALNPLYECIKFDSNRFIFENTKDNQTKTAVLGKHTKPTLTDLFKAFQQIEA